MTLLKSLQVRAGNRAIFEERIAHNKEAILASGGRLRDIKIAADETSLRSDYWALLLYELDSPKPQNHPHRKPGAL